MTESVEQELKEIEKQLSLLLVRFMKLADALDASGGPVRASPGKTAVAAPAAPPPRVALAPDVLRAYA